MPFHSVNAFQTCQFSLDSAANFTTSRVKTEQNISEEYLNTNCLCAVHLIFDVIQANGLALSNVLVSLPCCKIILKLMQVQ